MARQNKIWRIIDMIQWAEDYFRSKNFHSSRMEIEWLLTHLLQCQRIDLYVRFEEQLDSNQLTILRGWIKRRLTREPLQYITGKADFYDLEFDMESPILIPRPETERVVETALKGLQHLSEPAILDIGCGCGCIAVTLGSHLPQAKITGIDIDKKAIALSQKNALKNNVKNTDFMIRDILEESDFPEFDLIVSNPPYIPLEEMSSIMDDVSKFESAQALTDNEDGLVFYRRLADLAPAILRSKGQLILEVGRGDHPEKAKALFMSEPFYSAELLRDYNGDFRVLTVRTQ